MSEAAPITFRVTGTAATRGEAAAPAAAHASGLGRVKQSVKLSAVRGTGTGTAQSLEAVPGDDVVVLQVEGGPELVLHPENARDLLMAQRGLLRGPGGAGGAVDVAATLQWRGLMDVARSRGSAEPTGQGALSAFEVLTGLAEAPLATLTAQQLVEHFDQQAPAGLFELRAGELSLQGQAPLAEAPALAGPMLVLVHGTFSTTTGTFAKLWSHPDRMQQLLQRYGRLFALEHATLGESPAENALALARTLPAGARLHLLTHSRGGLVAEVLARVCDDPAGSVRDLTAFGAGDAKQVEALRELARLAVERGLRVERIVRVACPARGTLLASRRLDAYLSVLRWSLQLAGLPVSSALVNFLGQVARRRLDPEQIPGLAAQVPDSPLVQWLHGAERPLESQLRVVAGDMQGDSLGSWLKTLVADAFFWTDNDLVVHTRSMYGGAPRARGAAFMLDQRGEVSHFAYFGNEPTARAVADALTLDEPPGFKPIGPLSWAGESSTGVRGAPVVRGPQPEKPAVVMLPGIVGSHLAVSGARIWLGWRLLNRLPLLAYGERQPDGVTPDGMIGPVYDELQAFLSASHEVLPFDYDWRRPIEVEADRLAQRLREALDARRGSGQPVRLLAHSMGGLVVRTMALRHPPLWKELLSRQGGRLLMLGTPNGGSWAPMQVLSGDDTFGNALTTFGAPFQGHKARTMMAAFPGLLQLQAGLRDADPPLRDAATWQKLADDDLQAVRSHNWWHSDDRQLQPYRWGVPPQAVLDAAVELRKRLDAQREALQPAEAARMLLVLGRARRTPDGIEMSDEGLAYRDAIDAGDGRVMDRHAQLPGVATWRTDCDHGSLPSHRPAFDAYLELLTEGSTQRLPIVGPGARSAAGAPAAAPEHVRSRPSREGGVFAPPVRLEEVLRPAGGAEMQRPGDQPVDVCVAHQDLRFIPEPLIVGHYESLKLTGTEAAVDGMLDGGLNRALSLGLYPQQPGRHAVFVNRSVADDNPWLLPRPAAVVVAGLGQEGKLRASELTETLCDAMLAWAQRAGETDTRATLAIACTLVGSGGLGVNAGQAAQCAVRAVLQANDRLAVLHPPGPRFVRLVLTEIYLDRATEAWRALQALAAAPGTTWRLAPLIASGVGGLLGHIASGYRGTDHDLIIATAVFDSTKSVKQYEYRLDTRRARSEISARSMQASLVSRLIADRSASADATDVGTALFRLLVPADIEPYFADSTAMQIELDDHTAAVPWELLDPSRDKARSRQPWAMRTRLLRKLRTARGPMAVADAGLDDGILIIGEPACPDGYARLPGARAEASLVRDRFEALPALRNRVVSLISTERPGADASAVACALAGGDWRIVHISGHGEAPLSAEQPRGIVLSDPGVFLGPDEIRGVRRVPELVFLNCCFSGARPPDAGEAVRPLFAASVAWTLIDSGVRCVVVAGWAVDDAAAQAFAAAFYDALLRGARYIDAVAEARSAAWRPGDLTWGAYQCYGDPDWRFMAESNDAQAPSAALADEFAGIASAPALVLALQTLRQRAEVRAVGRPRLIESIVLLEKRFGEPYGAQGAVAQAFAGAWDAAGDRQHALRWLQRAASAEDGGASLKALETLCNLQAREAWDAARKSLQATSGNAAARDAALDAAVKQAESALDRLETLNRLEPSAERASLCGSASKRLCLLHRERGDEAVAEQALARMEKHYRSAWRPEAAAPFYAATNVLAAHVSAGKPLDAVLFDEVRAIVQRQILQAPDFWSVVAEAELEFWRAGAAGEVAARRESLLAAFADLHGRLASSSNWKSVRDQSHFVSRSWLRNDRNEAEKAAIKEVLEVLHSYAA
jgi:triacylglycerol esterase/lipase EstA (alpha/beta hydrolase family)